MILGFIIHIKSRENIFLINFSRMWKPYKKPRIYDIFVPTIMVGFSRIIHLDTPWYWVFYYQIALA